jgi:uncharacterized repeat protein (TIGR01451 family)
MFATPGTPSARSDRRRASVFLALLALLGAGLVLVHPTAAQADHVEDGCLYVFIELVHGETGERAIEEIEICAGGPVNDIGHGLDENHRGFLPGFTVPILHVSCSDEFEDHPVDADGAAVSPDDPDLVGFDDPGSTLDGWLAAPTEWEGAIVPNVRIENYTTGADRVCGPVPLPDHDPDPDPVDVTVAKVVEDPDGVLDGDEVFEMTLTCEGEDHAVALADGDDAWVFSDEAADELVAGDECSLVENLDHDADEVTVTFGGSAIAQGETVTLGEAGNDFVVTNRFEDEPTEPAGIIIELLKTNDADGDGVFTASETAPEEGSPVNFRLQVLNTNNVGVVIDGLTDTFDGITIDLLAETVDPEGAATLTANTCADLDRVVIPAGESETCTFTLEGYAPPAGEEITNTATVDVHEDGDPTSRAEDSATSTVDTEVPPATNPDIELVKEADVQEAEVGDVITYTYTVTNTGDVTLTDITLEDDVLGEIELESTTLEPGESTTGTATHTVTEDDLDAGEVRNVAVVTGWPPDGEAVSDTDDETVTVFEEAVAGVVIDPPRDGELPRTGSALLALVLWALLALGGGLGLLRGVPRTQAG